MNIKNYAKKQAVKQVMKILPNISDENLIKFTYLAEKLTSCEKHKKAIQRVRELFKQGHPSVKLAKNLSKNLSKNCREKLINNLIINWGLLSYNKRVEFEKKNGFSPPTLFVISPTMRCFLHCKGCYAGEYTQKDDLPIEVVDRLLTEAKEKMGIYFITISGGEPFIRKDMLEMYKKHNDMYFLVYTNGHLIDKELAKKLAELGNVAPGISVEGFEKETDERRGKGAYKKVLQAMDNLKEEGVMFGFSATPTRYNSDILASDKFVDFYIKKGCSFGWYFQYIPIGKKPDVSLMSTPEQRDKLRKFVHEHVRDTKPIFIGDFWNDGPYVGGCMAGGRSYLHINCKGDVEPCVFVHFAVDNIKDKTVTEALKSDYFREIRKDLKTLHNWLAPCTIIDNPWILRETVEKAHAYPTHPGAETIVKDKKIREHINKYSKRVHELTDRVFEEKYKKE